MLVREALRMRLKRDVSSFRHSKRTHDVLPIWTEERFKRLGFCLVALHGASLDRFAEPVTTAFWSHATRQASSLLSATQRIGESKVCTEISWIDSKIAQLQVLQWS